MPILKGMDPQNRLIPNTKKPIENQPSDIKEQKSFKLKYIINKRTVYYKGKEAVKYLVKFKGYSNIQND